MQDHEPWRLPHMNDAPNDTGRMFARMMREIPPFPESAIGITGPVVIPTLQPMWVRCIARLMEAIQAADAWLLKLAEFRKVYAQYRPHHSATYAARIAYGVAFRGLPF